MATHTIDKFKYGSDIFVLQDSGALQLTGGSVTGPVNFGDSVTMDEATVGDLVVNGAASFTNNIQVNTINGVNVEFATLMNYKGAKAATSNLPTSGNSQGDVWHVNADGSEWGWNGSAWEELGKAIDLSGYVPTSRTINGKALTGNISLTASDVGALPSSTVIPVNTDEKVNMNAASTTNSSLRPLLFGPEASTINSGTAYETYYRPTFAYHPKSNTLYVGSDNFNIGLNGYKTFSLYNTQQAIGASFIFDLESSSLTLGNKSGTISGNIAFQNINADYVTFLYADTPTTANNTIYLPNKSGTIALTSDLPSYGYTTSGNNRAVLKDSNGNLYVTQKDDNTNYYHTTGSWSGLTYTATANGGAGALAFTIPTGTTASTVAVGNHTHSEYVPMSSTSISVKSDEFRIRNNQSSATAQAGTSNPYVTSLLLGDGREITFDEYGDGYLAIHGNGGIFLHPQSGSITVYDPSKTYTVGTVVWYNRKYYRCITAITTAEAWTSSHWENISTTGGTVKVMGHILPTVTGAYDLGTSALKWNVIYATSFNGNATSASKLGTTTVGSSTIPIYLSNGSPTECSTYAGGTKVTLNNSDKGASTASFYAPTSGGTSGYYLKSNGSTSAPTWTNFPTIPSITLNGSSTTSPSFYAPTTAGTSGYYLKSTGSGAPTWDTIPAGVTVTLNGSTTTTPSFYAPTTAGAAGQALISNGSGAPEWGTAGASIQIVRW